MPHVNTFTPEVSQFIWHQDAKATVHEQYLCFLLPVVITVDTIMSPTVQNCRHLSPFVNFFVDTSPRELSSSPLYGVGNPGVVDAIMFVWPTQLEEVLMFRHDLTHQLLANSLLKRLINCVGGLFIY